jgi:hypothetical protein
MVKEILFPKIRAALLQLDAANDDHWTDDGLPVTSVVQRLATDQTITREDIQAAQPGFERGAHAPIEPVAVMDSAFGAEPESAAADAESRELTDEELLAVLTQAVKDQEKVLEAARQKQKDGAAEERAAIAALNKAQANLTHAFPPLTPEQNIRLHIEAQNAERAARAGYRLPPSQLDAAMSRGNARGWGRRAVRAISGPDGTLLKGADGKPVMPRPMQANPRFLPSRGAVRA